MRELPRNRDARMDIRSPVSLRTLVVAVAVAVLGAGCATRMEPPAPTVVLPTEPAAKAPAPVPEQTPPRPPVIAKPAPPVAKPSPPPAGPAPAPAPVPVPPVIVAPPPVPVISVAEGRARVNRLLPASVADRNGWAADIYTAFATLQIAPTPENICAVVAITEQESTFRADPQVPGLAKIAWKEIDRQSDKVGVPKLVVLGALALPSSNGKSYSKRIDAVKTERELSEIFEDFIGMVPLGKTFFADRNPVRTGGPMQVSIAYAESHAALKPYPYTPQTTIRHEVLKRRGGVYFGIAHLLDYPANYDTPLYRFADFNAGHYASRNAAFQRAVTQATAVALVPDGDLLRYDQGVPVKEPSATERALRTLAPRLRMNVGDIRRDLELARSADFERTALYQRLYALADGAAGRALPRAVLPQIELKSPKITRKLTTEWFANRVDGRYRDCLGRAGA
jgi:Protein of unknown function (DUF1615)